MWESLGTRFCLSEPEGAGGGRLSQLALPNSLESCRQGTAGTARIHPKPETLPKSDSLPQSANQRSNYSVDLKVKKTTHKNEAHTRQEHSLRNAQHTVTGACLDPQNLTRMALWREHAFGRWRERDCGGKTSRTRHPVGSTMASCGNLEIL